ncbi:MAG: type I 3-dehydroquinate dehydratase [Halobacteria archaeon]
MLDTTEPVAVGCITSEFEEKAIRAVEAGADAVEVRMDLYQGDVFSDLVKVEADVDVIATNRMESQGGEFEGSEEERIDELVEILDSGSVEAVDIELEAEVDVRERVLDVASRQNVTTILSHHDFERTPSVDEMSRVLRRPDADITKLAVTPKNRWDVLDLLEVTLETRSEGVATLSMEDLGKPTRYLAPYFGSKLTYGSMGESTGPGQVSLGELSQFLETI